MRVEPSKAGDFLCCGPTGCGAHKIRLPQCAPGEPAIPAMVDRVCVGDRCMAWVPYRPVTMGGAVPYTGPDSGQCAFALRDGIQGWP